MKNYVLLNSSEEVKLLYKELKSKNIKCTLAPTPRNADKCCGVAILYYNDEDRKSIEDIIENMGITINKFWSMENNDDPSRMKFC